MKYILSVVFFILMITPLTWAQSVNEEVSFSFIKAGAFYQTGEYAEAIAKYQSILDRGVASPAVYYNLANAYFKTENLGKAILYYEKAIRLQPRDPDIEANLRFARSLVERYGEEEKRSFLMTWMPHFHLISLDEITALVVVLFFLLGIVIFIGIVRQWRLSRQILWSGLIGSVFVFHCLALVIKVQYLSNQAVILTEVKAKFEPMDDATDHFQLGEGMVVKEKSRQYGWVKIERFDGRVGWIPEEWVSKI